MNTPRQAPDKPALTLDEHIALLRQTMRCTPEFNREDENDCGPSGRYWEPKESEE